jgi:ABC-type branched-subunit amino acid transport system ATPase component
VTAPDLELEGVTVRFGGLVAVNDVSLLARGSSITGLIGPNGAGKTTTFNACTGLVSLATGRIRLGERPLNGLATSARAKAGLGRTFQRMALFDSMTVAENVALGPTAAFSGRTPWGQLRGSKRERREITDRAESSMQRCGIDHLAGRHAGALSTGQRRLVELARAIASPFRFLLLDEPSSGLDIPETEAFARILVDYVAEADVGVLLVEHDMALVAAVCSEVYVLDFGRLIYSGTTEDTLSSDIVRAAYLGEDADGALSGPLNNGDAGEPPARGITPAHV